MWISYSDKEVEKYHPVCEYALNAALEQLGLTDKYQVIHHQYVGSLEMDFAIKNKITQKYLCVIEVKRTISAVNSARYQYQAMSYVQMIPSVQIERPYYILTNLESSCIFRYDKNRPRVFQQMVAPGIILHNKFSDVSEEQFKIDLINQYKTYIEKIIHDRYDYILTLEQFIEHMEAVKNDAQSWKSSLAIMLYEYIRGAFISVMRDGLCDIKRFNNSIERICREAAQINFKEIFQYNNNSYNPNIRIPSDLLSELFVYGKQNIDANAISSALHQVVSSGQEHDGEVPTDLELARTLVVLAKSICPDIPFDCRVCDPAAGSGNLLSCVSSEYADILPSQIMANDHNQFLLELLSLRMGLLFPSSVNRLNSPSISANNICELTLDYFENVKLVLMNPPFVAGINCLSRKTEIFKRINEVSHNEPITNVGQMPLEAPFLELISHYINDGTTIACILPKTHLTARGQEAIAIRHFLLKQFGLRLLFTYPGEGLFDSVTKDTCIVIGTKGYNANSVKIIASIDKIADIDLHELSAGLSAELDSNRYTSIFPGLEGMQMLRENLVTSVDDGWRIINFEQHITKKYLDQNIATNDKFILLRNCAYEITRGKVGNKGGNDLLYINSNSDFFEEIDSNINIHLKAGMRNAKYDSVIVGEGDKLFFDVTNADDDTILNVIRIYRNYERRSGRQARRLKSDNELIELLKTESRYFVDSNNVLIPRDIRCNGRVYRCNYTTYVSTNFFVISGLNEIESKVITSWISSVFYQLNCEISSKNQEGTRKMEKLDFGQTYIPNISELTEDELLTICNSNVNNFLKLQNPICRDVDIVWARLIFGDNYQMKLDEAIRLLGLLAIRRNA